MIKPKSRALVVTAKAQLPTTVQALRKYTLITRERINAHRAQISAIKKMGLSKDVYEQKLKEAQFMGRAVLWAEVKMGKILMSTDELKRGGDQRTENKRKSYLKSIDMTKQSSYRAQMLARNEEVVNESIEIETKRNKIPTVELALWKIREARVIKDRKALIKKGNTYKKELFPVIHSDFYSYCIKNIKSNSIDHILTDPPYTGKDFELWSQFAEMAKRVLKPSGYCICFIGTLYLSEFIVRMTEHLEYYWQVCVILTGGRGKMLARNVYQRYISVVIFQKSPIRKQRFMVNDCISSPQKEKELHPWQKSLNALEVLLSQFTKPGQLILEPFAGSGTTGVACMKKSRRCILIEKDAESIKITKARLKETLKEIKKK